jgi:hypothetical protein
MEPVPPRRKSEGALPGSPPAAPVMPATLPASPPVMQEPLPASPPVLPEALLPSPPVAPEAGPSTGGA